MNLLWMYINLVGFVCLVFLFLFLILQGRHTGNCTILFSPFFCSTLLYNDFIVNTYIYIYIYIYIQLDCEQVFTTY